jgi:hypothetical protein
LIGEIIDHDAGYSAPETFKGSDYESKQAFLFSFENHFPSHDYFWGRNVEGTGMLSGSDMDVSKLAVMIWVDMNGDFFSDKINTGSVCLLLWKRQE